MDAARLSDGCPFGVKVVCPYPTFTVVINILVFSAPQVSCDSCGQALEDAANAVP